MSTLQLVKPLTMTPYLKIKTHLQLLIHLQKATKRVHLGVVLSLPLPVLKDIGIYKMRMETTLTTVMMTTVIVVMRMVTMEKAMMGTVEIMVMMNTMVMTMMITTEAMMEKMMGKMMGMMARTMEMMGKTTKQPQK